MQGRRSRPCCCRSVQKEAQPIHAKNPIVLHDVFFRVGGAGAGKTEGNLEINSNDTIVDHTWIWRADHGAGLAGRRT